MQKPKQLLHEACSELALRAASKLHSFKVLECTVHCIYEYRYIDITYTHAVFWLLFTLLVSCTTMDIF